MVVDESKIVEMAVAWKKSGMTLKSFALISGIDIRELTNLINQRSDENTKSAKSKKASSKHLQKEKDKVCITSQKPEKIDADWEADEYKARQNIKETRRRERKSATELFHTNVAREVILKGRDPKNVAREYGLNCADVIKWADERRERLLAEDKAKRDIFVLDHLRKESGVTSEPPKKVAKRLWTEDDKRDHVRLWLESGLSVNRYAVNAGIDSKTMYRWVSIYESEVRKRD